MTVRMSFVVPLLFAVGACANHAPVPTATVLPAEPGATVAPQRVSAASEALAHRLDSMMVSPRGAPPSAR